MFSRAFVSITTLAIAYAKATTRTMQVHDVRSTAPTTFTSLGAAPADMVLTVKVQVAQNDIAGLEKALMDVSTPGNALYGQHLSKEELESYTAPKAESLDAVTAWLKENDIEASSASPAGDWLSFDVPVSKANEIFDADYTVFKHTGGRELIRTLSYSVPEDLAAHIDVIHPSNTFAIASPAAAFKAIQAQPSASNGNLTSRGVPYSCASTVTPACLQAMYGIPTTAIGEKTNVLAVSGFIDMWANEADLKSFLSTFRKDLSSSTTFALQTLDGGSNPQTPRSSAGTEANLDIQYTVGLASPVPVTFVSVGEDNSDGTFGSLDMINYFLNMSTTPTVLSISYGVDETDLSPSMAKSICNAYMALGARGTSILFASGDGGVAGGQFGEQSQNCTVFVPSFPPSCPYVTSVGATTGIVETAADFSSGGFSNVFGRPSYQSSAVSSYLSALGSTNTGRFNTTGRGFPDVSTQGVNFEIVLDARRVLVNGTSCSTPTFASVVALLNDELIAAGKSPLGFLNPFLYSTAGAAALTDVTSGSNPGCGTDGFPATVGWDPVTGLGTPNYAALRTAVGL
ncbi:family S53 protease-like protein [Epithele typhae]|uniref:family S53 protease-like protein n=1 Tax=Epithele typhae TaxID=378194 RepID=UPI002007F8AC|nr:family S53 protease-like protein [Epithele typhae]KAH9926610.1 family S53 protease-like protein [Epithele typhae]